jgi:hypothetical protein
LGLGQNVDGSLETNVDNSTIEISADTLQVKDLGIVTAKLADDAVDKDKVNADVAGLGLGQNVDGSLETNVDNSTIEISADTLQVKDLGIVTAKLADDAVLSGKIMDGEVKTADVADQNITTAKVADDAVDKDKVNADVAGLGLGQNADGSLETNVDGSTMEVSADALQVKDLGIVTAKLATDAVDKDKVNADVAGLGLGQNADGSLETNVDNSTIEISADTLQVKDLGIITAKLADDAVLSGKIMDGEVKTVDVADQNITTAKVADDAVDKDKVNADVAGLGLGQNADGSLETNIDNSTIEISADTLQVKDLGIVTAKLADDAVLSGKIKDGEVKTVDLADQNINTVMFVDD